MVNKLNIYRWIMITKIWNYLYVQSKDVLQLQIWLFHWLKGQSSLHTSPQLRALIVQVIDTISTSVTPWYVLCIIISEIIQYHFVLVNNSFRKTGERWPTITRPSNSIYYHYPGLAGTRWSNLHNIRRKHSKLRTLLEWSLHIGICR